ncbi:MAG: DNA polymerase III subunit gamma/tau [Desulfobacterales bacterium]|jgi:DNA polymerase-3 subunit gamma/tau
MSYLVLARKYRPQTFNQVIEQNHITRTLSNAISSDRVAHAVLFSGPRGTGKTTVARILAKAMNCKEGPIPVPCNQCRSCGEITFGNAVDVFEIDGASNNSVDQVRELRENIKYMPAHSLYKIYIIDEVHMLSIPAFNALLKTLEEPPPHVMFIFATTEPHKIPITILSRCQRHDFRRISLNSMVQHMAYICREEKFQISDESLVLIAREATGSMRDALSLLDQVLACFKGSVDHDQVLDILGVIDRKYVFDLCDTILRGDISLILDTLDDSYNRGHDLKKLYTNLLEHFRNLIVVKMGQNISKLVDLPQYELDQMVEQARKVSGAVLNQIFDYLYREEVSIRLSADTKLALEMAFIRMDQIKPALPIDTLIDKLDHLRQEFYRQPGVEHSDRKSDVKSEMHVPKPAAKTESSDSQIDPALSSPKTPAITGDALKNLDVTWDQLYEIIAQKNPALGASLAKCRLKQVTAASIEIEVRANGFTLNMLQREKNMAALKKICREYFGKDIDVVLACHPETDVGNSKKKSQNDNLLKQKALSHPLVADAIEIFNGKLIDVKLE